MSIYRAFDTGKGLRIALVLAAVVTALAVSPEAKARVRVGFSVNLDLPPGVHVNVGNYEPYYVGRVFYQPLNVWRPVYSFPVATRYGVVYEPYVYDHGRVICNDYIPGPEAGYGEFIIEGRGRYNPQWNRRQSFYGHDGHDGHDSWSGRGSYDRDRGWNQRQGDHGNRDRDRERNGDRSGNYGQRDRDHGRNDRERGDHGGHHGSKHRD